MKKVIGISFIVLLLAVGQGYYSSPANVAYANSSNDLMKTIKTNHFSSLFGSFFKFHDKDDRNKDPKKNFFMLKGIITASSSSSLTINNQLINMDSSVTGDIKIVGNIQTGSYAMVQGIIQNSNYYATRIIIDQRNMHDKNKEDEEKNEENEHITPTTTPSVTPTVTISPTITMTPTVTPTETVTPTLSPTPTGTQSASIEGTRKTNLTLNIQRLITMLQNLLIDLRLPVFKS